MCCGHRRRCVRLSKVVPTIAAVVVVAVVVGLVPHQNAHLANLSSSSAFSNTYRLSLWVVHTITFATRHLCYSSPLPPVTFANSHLRHSSSHPSPFLPVTFATRQFVPHVQVNKLYMRGFTSEVTDIDRPDLNKYPLFLTAEYAPTCWIMHSCKSTNH